MKPMAENRFRLTGPLVEVEFQKAEPGGVMRALVQFDGRPKPDVFETAPEFRPTATQPVAYAGNYRSDEIEPIYRITVEDGGLVLKRLKSKPDKLQPAIADYFQGSIGGLHFQRGQDGRISGIVLNTGRIRNFQLRKAD